MPASRGRKSEGYYFVVVDGVPPYCQWQELKDYLRDSVAVKPRHCDVFKANEDGTRVGHCELPTKAEANKAFEYLVAEGWKGLDIRVTLIWKPELSSETWERRRGPDASRRRRLQTTAPAVNGFRNMSNAVQSPVDVLPYTTTPITQVLKTLPFQPNIGRQIVTPYAQYAQAPDQNSIRHLQARPFGHKILNGSQNSTYPSLSTDIPSLRPGSTTEPSDRIYTDCCSIHISKLPYDTRTDELRAILSPCGPVSDVFIKRSKDRRCSATAKYRRSSEATFAIESLNGKRFRGFQLVVRQDRSEAGSVSPTRSPTTSRGSDTDSSMATVPLKQTQPRIGPLVVDGAKGPAYYKKSRRDDDSESTADESEDFTDNYSRTTPRKTSSRKDRR